MTIAIFFTVYFETIARGLRTSQELVFRFITASQNNFSEILISLPTALRFPLCPIILYSYQGPIHKVSLQFFFLLLTSLFKLIVSSMIRFNKLGTVDYTNISVNLKGKTNCW